MIQNPELLIDKEFEGLIFEGEDCTPLFHPIIIRKIRKKDGYQVRCPSCSPTLHGVKQGMKNCPYCKGIGLLWDDKIADGWVFRNTFLSSKNTSVGIPLEVGDNDMRMAYAATHKSIFLDTGDYIIVPTLDLKGRMVIPLVIRDFFKVIDSAKRATNQRESEFNISKVMLTKEVLDFAKE